MSEDEKKRCLGLLQECRLVSPGNHRRNMEILCSCRQNNCCWKKRNTEGRDQEEAADVEQRANGESGKNPREFRRQLRESLDQGFYVAVSSKKIRTLHLLGECYLLSTLDYTTFSFLGPRLPICSLSDQTCKLCGKSGDVKQKSEGSSDCGTATSSSTEDDKE